jgi:hypothetical protein
LYAPFGHANNTFLAATAILYRSIVLNGSSAAAAFLETLHNSPTLSSKVKYIVLKIADNPRDDSKQSDALLATSQLLVQALDRCKTTISHLHLHPFHDQVRLQLFAILAPMPVLQTLVFATRAEERADLPFADAAQPLSATRAAHHHNGAETLALPASLRTLEVDLKRMQGVGSGTSFHLPSLRGLRRSRRSAGREEDQLWEVLSNCRNLEVCDVYLERIPTVYKYVHPCLSGSSFPLPLNPAAAYASLLYYR